MSTHTEAHTQTFVFQSLRQMREGCVGPGGRAGTLKHKYFFHRISSNHSI